MPDPKYSFAIFPFLKTSGPVSIGKFTFRPTEDRAGLTEQQSKELGQIAEMMFLQDDLRIQSCSYALVPYVDFDRFAESSTASDLEIVQAVVAYCYSAPDVNTGRPFFQFEEATLIIVTPRPVPIFLVQPEYNVIKTSERALRMDVNHHIDGFCGHHNFRHPFWKAPGSRIYPPIPHIGLNLSQELIGDFADFAASWSYALLIEALGHPVTSSVETVLSAIKWFNAANTMHITDEAAVINLAVAFEALLRLPKDQKTDRLVDAVSLLLGRVPRLDSWASQLYEARSAIVHQGRAETLRFVATDLKKPPSDPLLYRSLLSYGRQIFQLCVSTLLHGAKLADAVGLKDSFVTNQERFEQIHSICADARLSPVDKLEQLGKVVTVVERYRFAEESALNIKTMVAAAQLASKALLDSKLAAEATLNGALQEFVETKRSKDCFEELGALRGVLDTRRRISSGIASSHNGVFRLLDVIWNYTFMHYYWLQRERQPQDPSIGP